MRQWTRTRWAIAAFIAIGVLVALVLIVRDLGGDGDVSEDEGTLGGSHVTHQSSA